MSLSPKVPRYAKQIAGLTKARKAKRDKRKKKGVKKSRHHKSSRRGTRLTFYLKT